MSAPARSIWTQPGERRRKIVIQQENVTGAGTRTTSGYGFLAGGTANWSTVLTTWAKVTPRPMSSYAASGPADEPMVRAVYVLNIRYVPNVAILPGMRVVEQDPASTSATYLIQNVVDRDEMHREYDLFCSQIPAPAAETQ